MEIKRSTKLSIRKLAVLFGALLSAFGAMANKSFFFNYEYLITEPILIGLFVLLAKEIFRHPRFYMERILNIFEKDI